MQHPTKIQLPKVSQNSRCFQHTGILRTLSLTSLHDQLSSRILNPFLQSQSMGNWNDFWSKKTVVSLHSMEDHIKRLLHQHSQQHKQLSCTWNANMKWSTGQSGLIRTLRQVIKSTVASMNARQRQQTSQTNVHMNENYTKNKFTSCKFQVSQTNCFTFPKTIKLQLSANSRKFMQTSLCKTQQSLSSLASSPRHLDTIQLESPLYYNLAKHGPNLFKLRSRSHTYV